MDPRRFGMAYAVVTGSLMAVILLSGWCWTSLAWYPNQYQWSRAMSYESSDKLHEFCLFGWALSCMLLGLSQVAFIVVGRRLRGPAETIVVVFAVMLLAAFVLLTAVLSMAPLG
jgi:hypothetical protein